MELQVNPNDYDWDDLKNYPNVGKDKSGKWMEFSFNGNSLLRPYNVEIAMTKEAKEEWVKCSLDKKYFFETYLKIQTLDHGIIPFILRPFQHELLDLIDANSKTIACIARQCGKTTTNSANIVWHLCFMKEFTVGIVANRGDLTTEIVGMVKQMYELLPAFLQSGIRKWNATRIELENKNKVMSAVAGPSALRGRTLNYLLVDETAHIEELKIKGFFDSVMPALSSGDNTKIVLISTPKGYNKFFNIFRESEEGINGYVNYKATWRVIVGRDEDWKRQEIASTSIEEFAQNHEVAFIGSSKTLLSTEAMLKLSNNKKTPIDVLDYIHPDMKVYEHPIISPDIFYTVSLDSAKISSTAKENSDYVALQVLKFDIKKKKISQVATMRTRDLHYTELSEITYHIAVKYNNALIQIENNSEGQGIVDRLFDVFEYDNIYSDSNRNDVLGYRTTKSSKSRNLSNLKKLIEDDIMEIYDIDTIDEFYTFVQKGSSYSAISMMHDDAIMALAGNIHFLGDTSNEMDFSINDIFERNDKNEHGEEESSEDLDFVASNNSTPEMEDLKWLLGES